MSLRRRPYPIPVVVSGLLLLVFGWGGISISLSRPLPSLPLPSVEAGVGSYYRGDGLGVNHSLEITADGKFRFRWEGCLGSYAETGGEATRHGAEIFLKTLWHGRLRAWDANRGSYLPIRWGGRHYLIPAKDKLSWFNEINLGREPRDDAHGMHYLRQDDWQIPVSGLPEVSSEDRQFLLAEPIGGTILRLAEGGGTVEIVTDRGPAPFPGMLLVAAGGDEAGSPCELKVVSVTDRTAVADMGEAGYCTTLHAGDRVFSRLADLPGAGPSYPGRRWLR